MRQGRFRRDPRQLEEEEEMWFNDDEYEDDTPSSASTTPAAAVNPAASAAASVVASNVSSSSNNADSAIANNASSPSPVDQPLAAAAALAAGSSNGQHAPVAASNSPNGVGVFNQQNLVTSTSGNDHGASNNEVLSMAELASSKTILKLVKGNLINYSWLFLDKLSESRSMNPTVRLTPLQNNTKKVRKFNFVPKSAIRKNISENSKIFPSILK